MNCTRWMSLVGTAALALGAVTGCANKGFVEEGFMAQDSRIADIESGVEANERRLKRTGESLERVSEEAGRAARESREAAKHAREAYELAQGRLLYTVTLSEVAGNFQFDTASLTPAARQRLDEIAQLMREDAHVYLEIEGHTDSVGPENYNLGLGLRRAEAARQYLNREHTIPLHRMTVTSYGESSPVADNTTKEGRARNRRVEVRVLS